MTNRTDHGMRVAADTPRKKGRQVALAASVALCAVTGTATIAWSALTVAFSPQEQTVVTPVATSAGPEMAPRARAFAERTRLQSAAASDTTPGSRPAPVVLAQAATSQAAPAAGPAHRGAASLEAAVQPKPFSATRPAADPRPVARPAPDAMAPQDTPTATPAATDTDVVVAPATPAPEVADRPAPEPASEPARTIVRTEKAASDRGSLLDRLWSVGMYR